VGDVGNSGDFIFIGLVGMSDDIREDALSSIHNL
jgi:magnesium-transporting ATPase (P-type)